MRPSLLPGPRSRRRSATPTAASPTLPLFEVGQIYRGDRPEDQVTAAAGPASRHRADDRQRPPLVRHRPCPVTVFDAKADALATLDALGLSPEKVQVTADAPAWFHPGRLGTIRLGPKTVIGTFGEFHPKVLELIDAEGPLAGSEIILEAIPLPKQQPTKTKAAAGALRPAAGPPRLRFRGRPGGGSAARPQGRERAPISR